VDGVGAAQPAGARRNCELLPEVGGHEHDLVDRIGEHQIAAQCNVRAIHPAHLVIVNISQIVLGLTGLSATAIMTLSKQLELVANAINHADCASTYSELHRQIRAELVLLRMNDSSYASPTEFVKTCAELNRIEESAPDIPERISKRVGPTCCSPAPSPPHRSSERV
jgi:hypothetical protein